MRTTVQRPSPRWWRLAGRAGAGAAPALGMAAGVAGWAGAGAVLRPSPPQPPRLPVRCDRVERIAGPVPPGPAAAHPRLRVELRGAHAARPGTFGLWWDGGHGVVGPPHHAGRRHIARTMVAWWGMPPAADGTAMRLAGDVWPDAAIPELMPATAVDVAGPAGPLPAWLLPPSSLRQPAWTPDPTSWWPAEPEPAASADTWLIAVHGRGSSRSQALRVARTLGALGCASLLISYRNDPGAPGDGTCRLGTDEWADVEAAVAEAHARGARRILLAGWSMGGAIVATFLRRSALAASVDGVLLDSPVLDWAAAVRRTLQARKLPPGVRAGLVGSWKAALRVRARLDWAELDQRSLPERLAAPVLLIHGTADDLVPVATSDALAAARPDLVTYLRLDGAEHLHGWNRDPARYDSAVAAWATGRLAHATGNRHHGARPAAVR